jgi:ribosomal protein L14
MSRRETPMTVWYWKQIGGTLIEEFPIVQANATQGKRLLDAIIILGEQHERMPERTKINLDDKDIVIIQTKNSRLGMSLMGQTFFSLQLVKHCYKPRSILSIALCARTDNLLQAILEENEGCKVVVCPEEIWASIGSDT